MQISVMDDRSLLYYIWRNSTSYSYHKEKKCNRGYVIVQVLLSNFIIKSIK